MPFSKKLEQQFVSLADEVVMRVRLETKEDINVEDVRSIFPGLFNIVRQQPAQESRSEIPNNSPRQGRLNLSDVQSLPDVSHHCLYWPQDNPPHNNEHYVSQQAARLSVPPHHSLLNSRREQRPAAEQSNSILGFMSRFVQRSRNVHMSGNNELADRIEEILQRISQSSSEEALNKRPSDIVQPEVKPAELQPSQRELNFYEIGVLNATWNRDLTEQQLRTAINNNEFESSHYMALRHLVRNGTPIHEALQRVAPLTPQEADNICEQNPLAGPAPHGGPGLFAPAARLPTWIIDRANHLGIDPYFLYHLNQTNEDGSNRIRLCESYLRNHHLDTYPHASMTLDEVLNETNGQQSFNLCTAYLIVMHGVMSKEEAKALTEEERDIIANTVTEYSSDTLENAQAKRAALDLYRASLAPSVTLRMTG